MTGLQTNTMLRMSSAAMPASAVVPAMSSLIAPRTAAVISRAPSGCIMT